MISPKLFRITQDTQNSINPTSVKHQLSSFTKVNPTIVAIFIKDGESSNDKNKELSFENKTVREKNITGRPQPPQCKDYKSCKGRCGFQRQFSKNNHQSSCFCDPECNTVFKDCCADFHQQCNTSFLLEHHIGSEFDNRWKCMDVDHHNIWMIRRCRPGWNDDEVLRRCTEMEPNNTSQLIPVIDQYNNTFFN